MNEKIIAELRIERAKLVSQLKQVDLALDALTQGAAPQAVVATKTHTMSKEGREAVRAAQVKRWAKFHAEQAVKQKS